MTSQFSPSKVPQKRPGRPGSKRAENRRKKTQTLCEAALTLFLERGIERVTIDEIAKEAEVAKGSFYRYFESKEDLVEQLFSSVRLGIDEAFQGCELALEAASQPSEVQMAYQILALGLGQTVLSSPKLASLYLQESRGPGVGAREPIRSLSDRIDRGAQHLTHIARDRGLLRAIDPRVSTLAVIGAVERLLFAYLAGEPLGAPDQVNEALLSLILDGLRPR
jgi:AcrR family transcriptional regulator